MKSSVERLTAIFISFVVTLFLLLLVAFSYFYAQGQNHWLLRLWKVRIFQLPFILYLVIIALGISLLLTLVLYLVDKAHFGRLEKKIALLALGKYDSDLFEITLDEEAILNPRLQLELDIQKIRDKLVELSQDLQAVSSQPELVDGISKEKILQEERHRLARELHDSVSQQLFAATMLIATLEEAAQATSVSEQFQQQLTVISNIINAAQSEMRALLLHLRPITLEGKSLRQGIEQLLKELQTKIQIDLTWEVADVSLAKGMEDHLFRIVQELLSNTLRHAKASALEVYLQETANIVNLRMIDDGVGFDSEKTKVASYGLNNIQERVTGMGGTLKIISFKNKGTSIDIKIPLLKGRETE